jgi:isocitrate dehydrogenase kinase/phosphatase
MLLPSLNSPLAADMARAMIDGFNRHYRLFRTESARAKHRFETRDWHGQQRAQRERIEFYDLRVRECSMRLEREFKAAEQPMEVWQQVKLLYIGLLVDHRQPELAETFFNSVTTKILHRSYFHNDFIFAAGDQHRIHRADPISGTTYRAYYPRRDTTLAEVRRMVQDFGLRVPFEDFDRDTALVDAALRQRFDVLHLRANFQIQVLSSLFYRNKGAYVVGKVINGFNGTAVRAARPAQPAGPAGHRCRCCWRRRPADAVQLRAGLLHGRHGGAVGLRAVPAQPDAAQAARRNLQRAGPGQAGQDPVLPRLPATTSATAATVPHRARHQGHGDAGVRPASFPLCSRSSRTTTRRRRTPRASRSRASTCWSSSTTAWAAWPTRWSSARWPFPRDRFDRRADRRTAEIRPSQLEISDRDGDGQTEVILKHVYIERRMIPLNIYLQEAFDILAAGVPDTAVRRANEQLERAVVEYGNAIKDLVAANIFPGDMLWKNFGVTRHGKVVFYDYDEIEYITDCNFRRVPPPRNEEDEMSGEVWYSVGPRDVFPETFGPFLLGNPRCARSS